MVEKVVKTSLSTWEERHTISSTADSNHDGRDLEGWVERFIRQESRKQEIGKMEKAERRTKRIKVKGGRGRQREGWGGGMN